MLNQFNSLIEFNDQTLLLGQGRREPFGPTKRPATACDILSEP